MIQDNFHYRCYADPTAPANACLRPPGLGEEVLRRSRKTSQEAADFIDYYFGGGALTLVAARWTYTGKLHENQGDPDKGKIDFYYRVYTPNDRSYRRAIVTARKVGLSECIALSDIYETFGRGRKMAYPDSGYYAVNYHFNGSNIIDLSFTFDAVDAKCLSQIAIFQNRWK
ncbi:hypothetical protein LA345_33965 [Burkholderia vietnamiensis]|uniref:Uncharacterized protein n=1 Tax=Burkholderia vietnamiensis (strain G4 / LMG 22486) TaxID=269482 RepID=A4JRV2_BURVG|nr:hypothetical protein Bcep1808_6084 [Burkholderia vietnamiensis G4]MCB4348853.1 hypothetical protein [Burkholderia vietnamiensis]